MSEKKELTNLKVTATKNFFSDVYVTDIACFDKYYFYSIRRLEVIIFHKSVALVGTSFLREVRILC